MILINISHDLISELNRLWFKSATLKVLGGNFVSSFNSAFDAELNLLYFHVFPNMLLLEVLTLEVFVAVTG